MSTTKRRATIDAGTQQSVHVRIVPSIDNPNRSMIFDIVDRELEIGSTIRIGRYSERHSHKNCMSFKSKVVSRCHCEVWTESDGKVYNIKTFFALRFKIPRRKMKELTMIFISCIFVIQSHHLVPF